MIIIKLGGSVITEKSRLGHFREKTMKTLAKEMKEADVDLLIVHGAGSFGHIFAEKYSLNDGFFTDEQRTGFVLTHAMVQKLNSLVLESLHEFEIPAISIAPHDIVILDNHQLETIQYEIFEKYLNEHFTPLTFGDVVLDTTLGFSICSGDLLVMALAKKFKPQKVIFVVDVDGLYTSNPKINDDAQFIEEITLKELNKLTTSLDDHPDVTSGMEGKLNMITKITQLNIDTVLLNGNKPGRLYDVLTGHKTKSTVIKGC